jgi:putative FmdB family regulatory protein
MPTYQYACVDADCGNQFELVQSFTDPAASECPVCAGPVRKVFSAVGVVFKGSGFYRTDSRAADKSSSKSAPKPAAAEFSSAPDTSAPSSSSSSSSDAGSSSSAPSTSTATPAKAASA